MPSGMRQELRIMAAIHDQSLTEEILVRLRRSLAEDAKKRAAGDGRQTQTPAAETTQKDGQEAA
ncbi:hypothetical protein [Paracoccus aerius]